MHGEAVQGWEALIYIWQAHERTSKVPGCSHHIVHEQEILRRQPASLLRSLHLEPDVSGAADCDIWEIGNKVDGFGGDGNQVANRRQVSARAQLSGSFGGNAKPAALPKPLQDLIKL
jgi:hypothetical protein